MKNTLKIIALFLLISFNILAQDTAEYNGVKMYYAKENQTVFKEGEQVLFYSVVENTNTINSDVEFIPTEILINLTTGDTLHESSVASHGSGNKFYNSSITKIYPYPPKAKRIFDSRYILLDYGKHKYSGNNTYLPSRLYYFSPAKYRVVCYIDVVPKKVTKIITFDFEVKPFEGNEKQEYEDYLKAMRWSTNIEKYDRSNENSFHGFINKYPNSIYNYQIVYYLNYHYGWKRRALDKGIDYDFVKSKYEILDKYATKSPNPCVRYSYADMVMKNYDVLKEAGVITDPKNYYNKILKNLKNDKMSSELIFNACKSKGIEGLKNYAEKTD